MVHFTCDLCGRKISDSEARYQVNIDIETAFADHGEFEDFLDAKRSHFPAPECFCDAEDEWCDDEHHHFVFDLCEKCRDQYLADPLLGKTSWARRRRFGYSRN